MSLSANSNTLGLFASSCEGGLHAVLAQLILSVEVAEVAVQEQTEVSNCIEEELNRDNLHGYTDSSHFSQQNLLHMPCHCDNAVEGIVTVVTISKRTSMLQKHKEHLGT